MVINGQEYDNKYTIFSRAAEALVSRGIPVVPIPEKEKGCQLKDWQTLATTDPAVIKDWQKKSPRQNVGAVAKADGFCILDVDDPNILLALPQSIPATFTVKSSKGYHYYFKQTDATRALGNQKKQGLFDFQQHNKYVVGPYSIHPSGIEYKPVSQAEIANCPDWLCDWIKQQAPAPILKKSGLVLGTTITPDQFEHWLELHDCNVYEGVWNDGEKRWMYILADQCPWEHFHGNKNGPKDAAVFLGLTGLGFHCCHSSCNQPAEKHWKDFREWLVKRNNGKDYSMVTGEPIQPGTDPIDTTTDRACWVRVSEIKEEYPEWLWEGRIPLKSLIAFAGDPAMGKTTMALDIMARGSIGEPFLDGAENKAVFESILLSDEDDPATVIKPRLMGMDAEVNNIHMITCVKNGVGESETERMVRLDTDLQLVKQRIAEYPNIKLVVIDPLSNYAGDKNIMHEQEIRQVIMPISRMAKECNVAVIFIFHNSKQHGRGAIHKPIGAVGNVGACRIGWAFMEDPDNPDYKLMIQSKDNLGKFDGLKFTTDSTTVHLPNHAGKMIPTSQAYIKYLGKSNAKVNDLIQQSEDVELKKHTSKKQKLIEALEQACPVGMMPSPASELLALIKENTGMSQASIDAARKDLGIEASGGQHSMWSRPAKNPIHKEL